MCAVLAEDGYVKSVQRLVASEVSFILRVVGFEQVFVMHGENAVHRRKKTVLKNRIVTFHNSHGLTF